MKTFATFKKQLLKDTEINKSYHDLESEFILIRQIIEKRTKKGLTQTALARKIGTKQSAIARLESGTYNPSIAFLEKVAKALDSKLEISIG